MASALRELQRTLAHRVLIEEGGLVSWDKLYNKCRLWEMLYNPKAYEYEIEKSINAVRDKLLRIEEHLMVEVYSKRMV